MLPLIESSEQQIKTRIIQIMAGIKRRLSLIGIRLGTGQEELPIEFALARSLTLVERIQERGGDMSSNRFADIFTSRPNRMVKTTIAELVITFETILDTNPQILCANELLELCHLTRLPIAHISRFAPYFADDEWRTALQLYKLMPVSTHTDTTCVGRDELIKEIIECLMTERRQGAAWTHHVLLSGLSGIGKSTVATAVIRAILPASGLQRIPVVVIGSDFTLMEQVYQKIGFTMRLSLRAELPWALRLRDANDLRNTIICLDNVLGNDILPAETIVRELLQNLPTTQFLITSQIAGLGQQLASIREYTLTGLNEVSTRALYWQVFHQTHLYTHIGDVPSDILTQTNGHPMHIVALANSGDRQVSAIDEMYQQVIQGLGKIPESLLQIMALVQHPLGKWFWTTIKDMVCQDQQTLISYLHLLERRQLIIRRNGDDFVIHDTLRTAVLAMVDAAQIDVLVCSIAEQLTHQQQDLRDAERDALQLEIHDVLAIYDILVFFHQQKTHKQATDELAINLIVRWRTTWIRFGLCAQLCVLSEATLYRIGNTHPQTSELLYAIGSFYGHRGIVESTARFLQQAMYHANLGLQHLIWAQAALEYALHCLQSIGWQESERLLLRVLAMMQALNNTYWVARCHDTLAYIYMTNGQTSIGLKQSEAALSHYQGLPQSLGLADAYSNRGLIFMAMGDYELARQNLRIAERLFRQFNTPNNVAAVHLRIAGVASLDNRFNDARFYLTQAFRQIERVGGFNDLLYVIDIGAGVALAGGDEGTALQLNRACNVIRAQMGLSRGVAFDDIIQRQLLDAQVHQAEVALPPLTANISELLIVVRKVLNA